MIAAIVVSHVESTPKKNPKHVLTILSFLAAGPLITVGLLVALFFYFR